MFGVAGRASRHPQSADGGIPSIFGGLHMTEYNFKSSETIWLPVLRDGSDLGSSFEHSDGYIYFLFGDTPSMSNFDPIGRTNVREPGPDGITLEILREYLTIEVLGQSRIDYISIGEFEVPTGGFSSG